MQEKKTTQVIFSLKLRRAMDAQAMTQAQLATSVGVSQASVFKWLNGSIPGSTELYRLARCFGCSMESLISEGESPVEPIGVSAWRARAMTAEQKLDALKSGVVALVKKY